MSQSQQLTIQQALSRAKKAAKQGKIAVAMEIYNAILQQQPNHPYAKRQLRKLENSSPSDQTKQTHTPNPPQDQVNALINLCSSGQLIKSEQVCRELLQTYPQSLIVMNLLGGALSGQGKLKESIQVFDKVIHLGPDFATAHNNRGNTLEQLGRLNDAVQSYNEAIQLKPDYSEAYYNRGIALAGLGMLDEAVESYDKAIQFKPDFAEAHSNLGTTLQQTGDFSGAIKSYKRAIQISPRYAEAHSNLGIVLQEIGDIAGAIKSCNRAIEINPNYAQAHCNLGNALQENGDPKAAIESYNHALMIKPDYTIARSHKLQQQAFTCDWKAIETDRDLIPDLGISTEFISPLLMLPLEDHPARHLKRSALFAQTKCKGKENTLAAIARPIELPERLKIAYFSGDFHLHPVSCLIVKMFALHNRSGFEIHAFSFGPENHDSMRAQIVNNVDAFHDVRDMPDKDIAELARSKDIDIAIDLSGYTQNGRWGILACRPAPIQVSYLGYPGSMGADFIDYLIADRTLIPEENQKFYSEKIVYMPHCYQVSDHSRESSQVDITRTALGLPETGFVFCCHNTNYKITPREFDIWARLLHKVEGSVLWLLRSNQWSEINLKQEAQLRGVDPDRLVFSETCEYSEYLARITKADLFLDTFNFNAGAMANDVLWCGLPLITKQGQGYVARMVSSLLGAIDLPELITTTEDDYEKLALDLATNPKRLKSIKAKLAANKELTPVFDTERFTRNIETAYTQMYEKYFAREKPDHLYVKVVPQLEENTSGIYNL